MDMSKIPRWWGIFWSKAPLLDMVPMHLQHRAHDAIPTMLALADEALRASAPRSEPLLSGQLHRDTSNRVAQAIDCYPTLCNRTCAYLEFPPAIYSTGTAGCLLRLLIEFARGAVAAVSANRTASPAVAKMPR